MREQWYPGWRCTVNATGMGKDIPGSPQIVLTIGVDRYRLFTRSCAVLGKVDRNQANKEGVC